MTIRTTSKTITFNRPFCLKGVDRLLPAGDYRVVTDEELIEGLSFPAYHRISTVIFVPAQSGSAVEMVTIEDRVEALAEHSRAKLSRASDVTLSGHSVVWDGSAGTHIFERGDFYPLMPRPAGWRDALRAAT